MTPVRDYALFKMDTLDSIMKTCLAKRSGSQAKLIFHYLMDSVDNVDNVDKGLVYQKKFLNGIFNLASLDSGDGIDIQEVFDFLKSINAVDESTYSILINYYSKYNPQMGLNLISEMKYSGIVPHVRSYRILLGAGDALFMNKVYNALLNDNLIPDIDTFVAIMEHIMVQVMDQMEKKDILLYYLNEYRKYYHILDTQLTQFIPNLVEVKPNGSSGLVQHGSSVTQLQQITTTNEQNKELLEVLYSKNPCLFDEFDQVCGSMVYDVVLDGANIALYNNNPQFMTSNIINVASHYSTKKILVVLSYRRKCAELSEFTKKYKNVTIFWVKTNTYDDLVWLYASIKNNSLLVTNDKMADHIYHIFESHKDIFQTWLDCHLVTYNIQYNKVHLYEPLPYSKRIQVFNSDCGEHKWFWFLPTLEKWYILAI